MEAMVVEFDTFDSHPPFLLNGDVGTGCLRVAFRFSLYIPAFPLCTKPLQPKETTGLSLSFHDWGECPFFLPLFGGRM